MYLRGFLNMYLLGGIHIFFCGCKKIYTNAIIVMDLMLFLCYNQVI